MYKKYNDGGLTTDGITVDPVSGNDIPLGSNAEDVRDDVDAKLSSGEYVVPADVVKYVGVAQLEKLVTKAKAGLVDMDENGRIGGEPVGEAEEVVMTLGGDLGTLDGYATGGMVPGTDIDGIINRVKAAAMKDPSIINMLKAKGVFIQEPQPQGQAQQAAMSQGSVPQQAAPPAMQGQNAPAAFADGGLASKDYSSYNPMDFQSGFDPYAHTPGFSAETNVTGQAPGSYVAPGAEALTQECPEGQVWDPETNACVPVESAIPVEPVKDNENEDLFPETVQDPNQWMKQYDYSNPETVFTETMTTMGFDDPNAEPKKKGLLESLTTGLLSNLGGGLVGKAMAVGNVAAANANAIILESKGLTEEANKIRAQVAVYEKQKNISGWPDAMKNGVGMAKKGMESEYGKSIGGWGTKAPVAAPGVAKVDPTVAADGAAAVNTLVKSSSDNGKMSAGQQASHDKNVAASKAKSAKSVAASEKSQGLGPDKPGGRTRTDKETGEKKETYSSKVARGGGYAKGGFVAPRAEAPTPKAKKNTKKGLGRK